MNESTNAIDDIIALAKANIELSKTMRDILKRMEKIERELAILRGLRTVDGQNKDGGTEAKPAPVEKKP